jgi:hypothetical protein
MGVAQLVRLSRDRQLRLLAPKPVKTAFEAVVTFCTTFLGAL